MKEKIRSTTVLCVRRDGKVVMAGDGQVTLGNEVIKASARKLRRLYNDKIAGGIRRLHGRRVRAVRALRNQAGTVQRQPAALGGGTGQGLAHRPHPAPPGSLLLVADVKYTYLVSGTGDVIEPDEGIAAIGSGGRTRWRRPRRCCATPSFRRGRSRSRPWRSPARSASTPMTTSPTRSWSSHGDLSARAVRG
jgi:ATP-dependent HslUV protease subunit HslV